MSRSVSYTIVGKTTPMSKIRTRDLINGIIRSLIQWWWQQRRRPLLPGTDQVKTGTWKKKKKSYNEIWTSVWALRVCVLDADILSWWFICASCLPAAPEEIHLRHVEVDVLIPKIMREKARERCVENVQGVLVCATVLSFVDTRFAACGRFSSSKVGKTHGLSCPPTWWLITEWARIGPRFGPKQRLRCIWSTLVQLASRNYAKRCQIHISVVGNT